MKISVTTGAIQDMVSDLIVVNLFEGVSEPGGATGAVNEALGGAIGEVLAGKDFSGKLGQTALLYPRGAIPAQRVLLVGLGERARFDLDIVRRVSAAAAQRVQDLGVKAYHSIVHGAGAGGLTLEEAAQALVEGTLLGSYAFKRYKTDAEDSASALESLTLVSFDADAAPMVEHGARTGQIIAESACVARDLVNEPANHLTPSLLAQVAQEMAAEWGLDCQVLDEAQMAEMGMGALLAVAQGSDEPARFIILEHNANRDDLDTYVVVGKGITFDSGGISIKPGSGMERMKADMGGAAATLGAMRAVAALDLPLHVVGLMPATENLPSGRAIKPGDVVTAMSGLSIEVISTDAEGRMILADALAYARRYHPKAVVDLATLTGGCVVALGHVASGLMGRDAGLIGSLKRAADASGEKVWELPLYEEYAEQIESDVADVKNSGGRPASTITGALFLDKFAQSYPWAHLDIAGVVWREKAKGYLVKGATGYGVRLVTQWLRDVCKGPS